ncbi:lasso peptide biosynthesis B2 protein [Novosphingobium sp. 28-62-57]|uniref:lasso peptide biosynthesis B2 protein n=1 Tax=Novosphingobium sp. 28-62-57 TaxID=1970409 RepID=UPI0025F1D487|nr:lasso peptide biosynthesis B2 protein [Novosphingobium sp. 28-62-57]
MYEADMTSLSSDFLTRRIATAVGVALIGDKAIVLDARHDRYTMWNGSCASALRDLRSGNPCPVRLDDCRKLEKHGLVTSETHNAGPWLTARDIRTPTNSALEGPEAGRVRPAYLLMSVWNCIRARMALRFATLHQVLIDLPTASRGRTTGDLVTHARAFDRARRFAPIRPRCLPDALAYAHMARREGFAVDLVFGVKLHPFEAHCWVQSGGLVLTDPLDKVRRFEVVLAL